MKWLTFKIQREPGFRFNLIDLSLLLALAAASAGWYALFDEDYLYLLPLYVGGSFFLFCNVFRIGNRMEVPWYLAFVVLTIYGMRQPEFPWLMVLGVCEAIKWGLIIWRIRRGPYVGAFQAQVERLARPATNKQASLL
jgi:hypothetical protein